MAERADILVLAPDKTGRARIKNIFKKANIQAIYVPKLKKLDRIIRANKPRYFIYLLKDTSSAGIEDSIKNIIMEIKKDSPLSNDHYTPSLSEIIKDLGISQEIFARIVGTSTRTIARWVREEVKPSRIYQERLDRIIEIHNKLISLLKKEAIHRYLRSYNHALGRRRPIDLLMNQQYDEVLSDLSALEEGVLS